MTRYEIEQKIIEIINDISNQDYSTEKGESLIDDFEFDSLMLLQFLSEVEEQFGIVFDINDDIDSFVNNINELILYIEDVSKGMVKV